MDRWRSREVSLKAPSCRIYSNDCADSGGTLWGHQKLPETTHFFLIFGHLLRYFPHAKSDHSVAWRLQDALNAATFSEWSKFKKRDSQDAFHPASQCPQKSGRRDARYVKVSRFRSSPARAALISFSTRLSTHPSLNQPDRPNHTTDASNTLYRSNFRKGLQTWGWREGRSPHSQMHNHSEGPATGPPQHPLLFCGGW